MIKIFTRHRDFLFLGILIFMVNVAIKRQKDAGGKPVLYGPAEPLVAQSKPLKKKALKDKITSLTVQIDKIMEQVDDALQIIPAATPESTQLRGMRLHLAQLKQQYLQNSPAFILLGPIGSTGVAMKENRIEKELLKTSNLVGKIVKNRTSEEAYESMQSVAQSITYNQQLLAQASTDHSTEQA